MGWGEDGAVHDLNIVYKSIFLSIFFPHTSEHVNQKQLNVVMKTFEIRNVNFCKSGHQQENFSHFVSKISIF